jgi:competence protein ComGC
LIEEMAVNNRTWRAKRIQGELIKSVVLLVMALMILLQIPATAQEKVKITFWSMEGAPSRH